MAKGHIGTPVSAKKKGVFMYPKSSLETTAIEGVSQTSKPESYHPRISNLIESFLKYAQYELSLAPSTVKKYREGIRWVMRDIGDLEVESITPGHFIELKQKVLGRGAGQSHVAGIVFAMKSFLRFCRDAVSLNVLDPKDVRPPKRVRREVIYLTNEEVRQFVNCIKVRNTSQGLKDQVNMDGLRFRTLVEVLLGTGMRISEALSLDRDTINFEKAEAKIIGKGNKERTVFFTKRALEWIRFYLSERKDSERPLFLTRMHNRLKVYDVSFFFRSYVKKSGVNKKITPHILRHTVATNLLFNGCPISHVKEILGHEQLETTCRFYLGVNKEKAKEAHGQYLSF